MKLPLNKIAEITTEITGISLTLMRQKCKEREVVIAKHVFMLLALDYGIWTKKEHIPNYLNISQSVINYAESNSYLYTKLLENGKKMIDEEKNELLKDIQNKVFRLDIKIQMNLANDILKNVGSQTAFNYSL